MTIRVWRFARDGAPPERRWFVYDAATFAAASPDAWAYLDRGGSTSMLTSPLSGVMAIQADVEVVFDPVSTFWEVTRIDSWEVRDAVGAFRTATASRLRALLPLFVLAAELAPLVDHASEYVADPGSAAAVRARSWAKAASTKYLEHLFACGVSDRALHAEMVVAQIVAAVLEGGVPRLALSHGVDLVGEAQAIRERFEADVRALFA